jgi:hypothetical protein
MALTLESILARCKRQAECRLWTGCCNKLSNLPQISDGAKKRGRSARRLVYELAIGPVPAGCEVILECNVPQCLEPTHMRAMTKRERMQRLGLAGGLSTPTFVAARARVAQERSDFTMEKAEALRARRKAGATLAEVAVEFSTSVAMASKIDLGKSWDPAKHDVQPVKVTRLPGCPTRSRFESPPWFRGEFTNEWRELRASSTTYNQENPWSPPSNR